MAGPCAGCVPERHSRAWDGLRHMATASPRHLSMGVMRHSPTLAGGEQQGSADQPIKQVPAGKLAGPAQVQGSIHCRDGPGKLELRGVIGQIVV